jgi:hypothetical protein
MAEVESDTLEGLVVDLGRSRGESSKKCNGIANIGTADNTGVGEFTKEATIAEAVLSLESGVVGGVLGRAKGAR